MKKIKIKGLSDNKIYLDRKNKKVLIKRSKNIKMTNKEIKKYCRTIRVLKNNVRRIKRNKSSIDIVSKLFF